MKKKYIAPEIEEVIVASEQQLLAGSITGEDVYDDNADPDVPGMAPELSVVLILSLILEA